MGRKLVISDEAESDLEDIWDYIADDNPLKADHFIDQLYKKCQDLAALDGVGRSRDELAVGLLSIPHKKYMLFFTRDDDHVSIVRILRTSRDIDPQFDD